MSVQISGSGLDSTFTAYKISLATVAKWPPANYTNPDRRRWLSPYVVSLQALATLVVAARVWTRMNKKAGGLGWDDAFIVLSCVCQSLLTEKLNKSGR
jgi:hypothetical protein